MEDYPTDIYAIIPLAFLFKHKLSKIDYSYEHILRNHAQKNVMSIFDVDMMVCLESENKSHVRWRNTKNCIRKVTQGRGNF